MKAAAAAAAGGASRRRAPPARRRLFQRRPRRAKLHEKRAGVRVTLEAALGDDDRERPRDANANAYPRQLRQSRRALPRDSLRGRAGGCRSGCRPPRRHLHGHVPRVGKVSGLVRGDRLGERDVELGGVERVVVAGVQSTKHRRRERRRRLARAAQVHRAKRLEAPTKPPPTAQTRHERRAHGGGARPRRRRRRRRQRRPDRTRRRRERLLGRRQPRVEPRRRRRSRRASKRRPAPLRALAHERGDARGGSREAAREERRRLLRRRKRRISRRRRDAGTRGERLERRSAKHPDALVVFDRVVRLVLVPARVVLVVLVVLVVALAVLVLVSERCARLERGSRSPAEFDAQVPSRGRKRPRVALPERVRGLGSLARDPSRSVLRAHESRRFSRGEELFDARREKLGTLGFAQPSSPEFEPALPVRLRADLRPARLPDAHEKLPRGIVQRPGLDPRVRRREVRLRRRAQEPRRDDEPRPDPGRRLPRRRRASQRGETPRRRRGRRRAVSRRWKRGARERRERPRALRRRRDASAQFQKRGRARPAPRPRRALQHRRQRFATLARHPQHRRRARSRRGSRGPGAVRDGGTRGVEDDVGDGRRRFQRRRRVARAR